MAAGPTEQRHAGNADEGGEQHRQQRAAECTSSVSHELGFTDPLQACRQMKDA